MKENYFLLAVLLVGSPLALGQDAQQPLDLAEPTSFGIKGACLVQCEQVFADCKTQCEDTSARADVRHYRVPDLPVGECVDTCKVDLELCRKDC